MLYILGPSHERAIERKILMVVMGNSVIFRTGSKLKSLHCTRFTLWQLKLFCTGRTFLCGALSARMSCGRDLILALHASLAFCPCGNLHFVSQASLSHRAIQGRSEGRDKMAVSAAAAAAAGDVPNCIKAFCGYVNKMLKPKDPSKAISGMKALLLDRESVSVAHSRKTQRAVGGKGERRGALLHMLRSCARRVVTQPTAFHLASAIPPSASLPSAEGDGVHGLQHD